MRVATAQWGQQRLANEPVRRIRYLFGDIARQQAAERELPVAVRRTRRRIERIENRWLFDQIEQAPDSEVDWQAPASVVAETTADTPAHQDDESSRLVSMVKRILGLDKITEGALNGIAKNISMLGRREDRIDRFRRHVEKLQDRVDSLEGTSTFLRAAFDDEQAEHEIHRLELDRTQARVRWLEERLKDQGDHEADYLPTPDDYQDERPGSYDELLDRLETINGVEFTGDPTNALELHASDTNEVALRTAWEIVVTLAGYVRARGNDDWEASLEQYLWNPPRGYLPKVSAQKFAPGETAATMKQYGKQRVFPVPSRVDASEKATMKSHFKLAQIGQVSPRMYVLDGHPDRPAVYIGYIGRHLKVASGVSL